MLGKDFNFYTGHQVGVVALCCYVIPRPGYLCVMVIKYVGNDRANYEVFVFNHGTLADSQMEIMEPVLSGILVVFYELSILNNKTLKKTG